MKTLDNLQLALGALQSNPRAFKLAFEATIERYGCAIVEDHELDVELINSTAMAIGSYPLDDDEIRTAEGISSNFERFGLRDGLRNIYNSELHHRLFDIDCSLLTSRRCAEAAFPKHADLGPLLHEMYLEWEANCRRILSATASFLWLDPNWFSQIVSSEQCVLQILTGVGKLTKSPKIFNPDLISISLSTEASVYRFERSWDRETMHVEVPKGCLFLTVGKMLQRNTNNILPSPDPYLAHGEGVIFYFSIPFQNEHEIRTLPECIGWNGDLYPTPLKAGLYREFITNSPSVQQ